MKTKEEILYKKWKQESLITVLDSLFVENVILPSMEEYAKAYYEDKKQPISHVDKAYVIGVSDEENIYSY